MTERPPGPVAKRILVTLDGGADGRATLEEMARLAAAMEAELVGLFVEESELLEAADLPVTRVLASHARVPGEVDAARMRRALKVWAETSRAQVAATAARWHVRWSFRVARGGLEESAAAEATSEDLLALGPAGRARRRLRPGAPGPEKLGRAPCSVLYLCRARPRERRPVAVLYEGDDRVLMAGAALARSGLAPLAVMAAGEDKESAETAARRAGAWLADHGISGRVEAVAAPTAGSALTWLREAGPGYAVLSRSGRLAAEAGDLVGDTSRSVLVI